MPAQPLTLQRLVRAVEEDAAIRRIRVLQPTGGPGDKIFPPTYPGGRDNDPPRHVFEHRRLKGNDVLCVLVDSVQSQANRLEESLAQLRQKDANLFPTVTVDFSGTDVADLGAVSALEAPHRIYDAILRDSEIGGTPFRDSTEGRALALAKPQNASIVYQLAPTALIFGAWNSTGEGGGLGAKFPRTVVSEIVGIGVATNGEDKPDGIRPGSRIDPLGIRSGVKVWKSPDGSWSFDSPPSTDAAEPKTSKSTRDSSGKDAKRTNKRKGPKEVKPSEINHSNIAPSLEPLGVSVDHLQHTFVLSFSALRRLHFPEATNGERKADPYARSALAALALTAALAQDRAGYFLRSRCDLAPVADEPAGFRLIMSDGKEEEIEITLEGAATLVKEAAAAAAKAGGVTWRDRDVRLTPQRKLVELVKKSREQALQGIADEEKGSGADA